MTLKKKEIITTSIVFTFTFFLLYLAEYHIVSQLVELLIILIALAVLIFYLYYFVNSEESCLGLNYKLLEKIKAQNCGEIVKITKIKQEYNEDLECDYDILLEREFQMTSGVKLFVREKGWIDSKPDGKYSYTITKIE